jgi:hypothetical protein
MTTACVNVWRVCEPSVTGLGPEFPRDVITTSIISDPYSSLHTVDLLL